MTDQEFAAMTRKAAENVGHLTDEGIRDAEKILKDMRDQIILILADSPTEYGEWYYSQMLKDVDRLAVNLKMRYTAELNDTLDDAAATVKEAVDEPLKRAGLNMMLPQASRQIVEMLTGYSPGQLIGGLTDDAKRLISTELRQGLLGVKSPWEIQKTISGQLSEAGPFRTIAARAEGIWRTEANRVFNVLSQTRYKHIEQKFPGRMLKQWLHSGNVQHPRLHHVELSNSDPIGINEKFNVNGQLVDGPHDPDLSVSETVRCGCTTILVFAL